MPVSDGPWVEQWLSADRFRTYLRFAGGDRVRALALHEWNARLNAALLHDFAHLEVGLRNLYDRALMGAVRGGERHWTEPVSFGALFPPAQPANARTHADLQRAQALAGGSGAPVGKVLAELTFGFWVLLTSSRNSPLIWTPHLSSAYPARSQRIRIHQGLDELRKARNRVAHHEPVRVAEAHNLTRRMRRYASYVSPQLSQYMTDNSEVPGLLTSRP